MRLSLMILAVFLGLGAGLALAANGEHGTAGPLPHDLTKEGGATENAVKAPPLSQQVDEDDDDDDDTLAMPSATPGPHHSGDTPDLMHDGAHDHDMAGHPHGPLPPHGALNPPDSPEDADDDDDSAAPPHAPGDKE